MDASVRRAQSIFLTNGYHLDLSLDCKWQHLVNPYLLQWTRIKHESSGQASLSITYISDSLMDELFLLVKNTSSLLNKTPTPPTLLRFLVRNGLDDRLYYNLPLYIICPTNNPVIAPWKVLFILFVAAYVNPSLSAKRALLCTSALTSTC